MINRVDHPRLTNYGVRLTANGGVFDGLGAHLELRDLSFAGRDFSVSLRVYTEPGDTDYVGDLISAFNPATRTGFGLGVVTHAGVTSSQSNYRNLQFFVDNDTSPLWRDCGRPGNATLVFSLAVHEGNLYAATFEHGQGLRGRVYRYESSGTWTDCQIPNRSNAVSSLLSWDGALYAATGRYDARGSALGDAANDIDESRIWKLENGKWTDCGNPPGNDDLYVLGLHHRRLYATPSYRPGLYQWQGKQEWKFCADPLPRFFALCSWRGHLYAATNASLRTLGPPPLFERGFILLPDADGVYRYDDSSNTWTGCGRIEGETQMYTFTVHRGELHVGTWPTAKVLRSAQGIGWEDLGAVHPEEKEIMGMGVYNGKLYAGTLPAADVYRLDGKHVWTKVGETDQTPAVTYRRAWSMAVHDGKLFVGTLPSGHVFAMQTGISVSDSRQLGAGWQHIAAVKAGPELRLFINGELRARTTGSSDINPVSDVPLLIGAGPHDFLKGTMRDLSVYARSLGSDEIASLANNQHALVGSDA